MRARFAAVVVLLASGSALADPPGLVPAVTAPPAAPADSGSYRGQVAASDGIAAGAILLGGGGPLSFAGFGGYVLGAPIIHCRHGRPGRAAISLVLRVGLPIAAAYAGGKLLDDGDDGAIIGVALGLFGGMAAASAMDLALLAGPAPVTGPTFTPAIMPLRDGGLALGVGGSF